MKGFIGGAYQKYNFTKNNFSRTASFIYDNRFVFLLNVLVAVHALKTKICKHNTSRWPRTS